MPSLILNADDFGYTPGVNRAVMELHRAGVLTSATLMAQGVAISDALKLLALEPAELARPAIGVGCHVVLVDGTPTEAEQRIPSLLTPGPPSPHRVRTFRPSLAGFVADLIRGRIRETEIELEAVAQIRALQALGIFPTHLDTHKHTHMFPRVLRPLVRAALQCGVKAIRNPFEPVWSRRASLGASRTRRFEVAVLSALRSSFVRIVGEAGLATTDGALGVLATGSLDLATLERLLVAAARVRPTPAGRDAVWELVCHPGYYDEALAAQPTRLGREREVERHALASARSLLQGFRLVNFEALR